MKHRFFLCWLVVVCLWPLTVQSKVTMPQLFQSGMVLQRGKPIPVWGKADAGEQVTITSISYVDQQPRNEGINVTVTYRPVEKTSKVVARTFQRSLIHYDTTFNSI